MIKLCRSNLLSAFSLALDLAENKAMGHAKKTAYLALKLGRKLGLSEAKLNNIYAAAFLHDIGVSDARRNYHEDKNLAIEHSQVGSEMVEKLPFDPNVSEYIRLHHINWDGSNLDQLARPITGNIPLGAQIIYLADQVDIRFDQTQCPYGQRETILNWLQESSGRLFKPEMVEAFIELASNEKFWLDYNFYNIEEILKDIAPKSSAEINLTQMENIAEAFARVIDNKSKFTLNHSKGLAKLIELTTTSYGFAKETVKRAKIAGLLHDLGKLAVPNKILDNPRKLNDQEFCIIKAHTYYTKMILGLVNGFEEIKEWAANHHETMDGLGYPEGIKGDRLSIIERLMSVCDVYQALTEDRPYRLGMTQIEAFGIIEGMVNNKKLCSESFEILRRVVN